METVLWFEVLFGKLETILFVIRTQFPTCISGMGGGALDPQALSILRGVYRLQGIQITSFTGKAGIFEQDNPKHQLLKSMAS